MDYTAFVIFVRNFLEIVLLIGIFLGVSTELNLKKEKDIFIAAVLGIVLSFFMPALPSVLGIRESEILSNGSIRTLEAFLLIITAVSIFSIVFMLRKFRLKARKASLGIKHKQFSHLEFDLILFSSVLTFLVLRDIEMGYFTTMFRPYFFIRDFISLGGALVTSLLIGIMIIALYRRFNVAKVFQFNKYALIFFIAFTSLSGIGMLILT